MRMTVAASPHIRGDFRTNRIMLDVILALLPAWLLEIWHSRIDCYADMRCLFFGGRILILCFYKIEKHGY